MFWLLLLPSLAVFLVATGILYQLFGTLCDRRKHTKNGRWVDIGNGDRLYVIEKGSGPTVLFESGIGATNLNWVRIQDAVSAFAYTVTYDRLGLGWSTPSRSPRTPSNIAGELHSMLEAAGVNPPYVLVGHSFGGLVVRQFTLRFPQEVAGVVLVDPMRIEEWPPLDESKQAMLDRGKVMTRYAVGIARLGVARLALTSLFCRSGRTCRWLANLAGDRGRLVIARVSDEVAKMPKEIRPAVVALWSRPGFYSGMYAHMEAIPDTVREVQAANPIQRIPVTVLTPGQATALSPKELQQIGDNVQQIIAPVSAHWIHLDEPELVIESIREVMAAQTSRSSATPV